MRTWLALAAATAALAVAAPAAAQNWQTINERQAFLESRIEAGVASGALNRDEAARLRTDFHELEVLEARYRDSGGSLSDSERADLDGRFTALSARIATQRNDNDWTPINARQERLESRIQEGLRERRISQSEAASLRADFAELDRLEARYRATGDGLSSEERIDLDRRFDALSARIYYSQQDNNGAFSPPTYNREYMRDREAFYQQDLVQARSEHNLEYEDIIRLRDEFRELVAQERRYLEDRRISSTERSELDRRYYELQWALEQLRRR